MPPRSGPSARYDGTQLLRPHQPNSVHAFISVTNERDLRDRRREQQADAAAIRLGAVEPDLRLLDVAADPHREQRRDDADEEDAAPAPDRHHDQVDQRGEAVADRPRALHERERLAAMPRRKRFRHQRRAGRPLAAHAEAEADAEDRELQHRLREAAGGGEDRVDQDRAHQRALAAEPIGDHAEDDAAGGGGEQRDRSEQAVGLKRQMQRRIVDQRRADHRVEHHVERVEHPAERRGDERVARSPVGLSPPRRTGRVWLMAEADGSGDG